VVAEDQEVVVAHLQMAQAVDQEVVVVVGQAERHHSEAEVEDWAAALLACLDDPRPRRSPDLVVAELLLAQVWLVQKTSRLAAPFVVGPLTRKAYLRAV
jgi:hypothetical protein